MAGSPFNPGFVWSNGCRQHERDSYLLFVFFFFVVYVYAKWLLNMPGKPLLCYCRQSLPLRGQNHHAMWASKDQVSLLQQNVNLKQHILALMPAQPPVFRIMRILPRPRRRQHLRQTRA